MNHLFRFRIFTLTAYVLALVTISGSQVTPAYADVPAVLTIEPWGSGTDTILNITVRHIFGFEHYVDLVEVDVDGIIQSMPIAPPQSALVFVVQYHMGEVAGTPTVSARANCNLHSWSPWSEPISVPEFSPLLLLVALASGALASIVLRLKASDTKEQSTLATRDALHRE